MSHESARLVFDTIYGGAAKELTDLIMASERAFDDFGKLSFFGKDKGAAAEQHFTNCLVRAIHALQRIGKIKDFRNAEESFTSLDAAMDMAKTAFPNWPRAYRYWDDFIAGTYKR